MTPTSTPAKTTEDRAQQRPHLVRVLPLLALAGALLAVTVLAQRFGPPASSLRRLRSPPNAAYGIKTAPFKSAPATKHQGPLPRRVSVRHRRPQAHNVTQYRNALDTVWVLVHACRPLFPGYSLDTAIRLQNQPHFGLAGTPLPLEYLPTEYGLSVLFRQR